MKRAGSRVSRGDFVMEEKSMGGFPIYIFYLSLHSYSPTVSSSTSKISVALGGIAPG